MPGVHKIVSRTCIVCGAGFEVSSKRPKKTCSAECSKKAPDAMEHKIVKRNCIMCKSEFETRSNSKAKNCSEDCRKEYLKTTDPRIVLNTNLIEQAEFYLSLGFAPWQVYEDFIRDYRKPEPWVRMLERRDLRALAARFRPLIKGEGYPSGWERPVPVDAA